MRNTWIWIVVIVVIVVGGFLWWQSSQSANTNTTPTAVDTTDTTQVTTDNTQTQNASSTSSSSTSDTTGTTGTNSGPATITYNGSSFSPSTVTIKKGDTVTWNDASGQMWIASAPHPAHTGYDGTSRTTHCAPGYTGPKPLDECSQGSSYTFTFNKVGSWPYHDHLNPSAYGTIVVTQ